MLIGRRIIRRVFFSLLVLFIFAVSAVFTAATLYKDELISRFIAEMNARLNTPVQVGKMEVSAFAHFPYVSLLLHDVEVQASHDPDESFMDAERVDFTINPFSLLTGNITFDEVTIHRASCVLLTQPDGTINYRIFKDSTSESGSTAVSISRISLSEVYFTYNNLRKEILVQTLAKNLRASVNIEGPSFNIWADGLVEIDSITSGKSILVHNLRTLLTSEILFDNQTKHLTIYPSIVKPDQIPVYVDGTYQMGTEQEIAINARTSELEAHSALALLPPGLQELFEQYNPQGAVSAGLTYQGNWENSDTPELKIDFELNRMALAHAESREELNRIQGKGVLSIPNTSDMSSSTLSLKDLEATLDDEIISGSLNWQNFSDPYISFETAGRIDVNKFLKFYPVKEISRADGQIDINLSFSGATRELKRKDFIRKVKATGSLLLEDIEIHLAGYDPYFSHINGRLNFSNNDVEIEQLTGDFGRSDFHLEGKFKNALAYLLFENEKIGIDARLTSEFIDMDELLSLGASKDANPYTFSISKNISLHFDCNIDGLTFRRFKPKNIRGDFKIRNQVAFSDQLTLNAMGGSMDLLGMADASKGNLIRVSSNARFDNIHIDSVFYVFENFNQSFLEDRHLKGTIYADINTAMILSDHLRLYPETLKAQISTSIRNGQLNNFDPMQKLKPYLNETELRRLRFSELRNDIMIRDKTIYLPTMEISSNATDLIISGTHTFDQKINYSIQAPLVRTAKYDPDEQFGSIEKGPDGQAMLYLKIVGTTSEYYVNLDREKVRNKIANDLKKEKAELKEIFKNNGKVAEDVELAEEEYFDWDDDGTRD